MSIIRDTDMGYGNLKRLLKQNKVSVDIGVFSTSTRDGKSIAEYAAYNEYGVDKIKGKDLGSSRKGLSLIREGLGQSSIKAIPERSFMRSTFDEQEKNAFRVIGNVIKINMLKPSFTLRKSAGYGGAFMRTEIVKKIKTASSWATPNAKSTIKRKGKNQPLIDKGILWKAILWKIRPIGG